MENYTSLGRHTILDMYECDQAILDNPVALEQIMLQAAALANATIIKAHFHQFAPQGVSGSVIIAESHFNIHTWPENGYAAIDLFTCGKDLNPETAVNYLVEKLNCKRHNLSHLKRGEHYVGVT